MDAKQIALSQLLEEFLPELLAKKLRGKYRPEPVASEAMSVEIEPSEGGEDEGLSELAELLGGESDESPVEAAGQMDPEVPAGGGSEIADLEAAPEAPIESPEDGMLEDSNGDDASAPALEESDDGAALFLKRLGKRR